jgi:hypothetical protein
MDVNVSRKDLDKITEELREMMKAANKFRDKRSGYIEGYADALAEVHGKLRLIGMCLAEIEYANKEALEVKDET